MLLVDKLLKQVEAWQSEAGHDTLQTPQSTLTEELDAHNRSGDKGPRDAMIEVQTNLAKSQQDHTDRLPVWHASARTTPMAWSASKHKPAASPSPSLRR